MPLWDSLVSRKLFSFFPTVLSLNLSAQIDLALAKLAKVMQAEFVCQFSLAPSLLLPSPRSSSLKTCSQDAPSLSLPQNCKNKSWRSLSLRVTELTHICLCSI